MVGDFVMIVTQKLKRFLRLKEATRISGLRFQFCWMMHNQRPVLQHCEKTIC